MYTSIGHNPVQYQRTVYCRNKACVPTTRDARIHFVTYSTALSHTPKHCPACKSVHIRSLVFSYTDYMCTSYAPMTQLLATALIEELNNQNSNRSNDHQLQIEDILSQLPKPPTSNGICPLHVSCRSCLGTFDVIRTIPSAHMPPLFCIWCGTSNVYVQQYTTTETADHVLDNLTTNTLQELATQYDVSLLIITALHDQWSHDGKETFFSEYLSSQETKIVLALAKGRHKQAV